MLKSGDGILFGYRFGILMDGGGGRGGRNTSEQGERLTNFPLRQTLLYLDPAPTPLDWFVFK
jgi:hypothetical protein